MEGVAEITRCPRCRHETDSELHQCPNCGEFLALLHDGPKVDPFIVTVRAARKAAMQITPPVKNDVPVDPIICYGMRAIAAVAAIGILCWILAFVMLNEALLAAAMCMGILAGSIPVVCAALYGLLNLLSSLEYKRALYEANKKLRKTRNDISQLRGLASRAEEAADDVYAETFEQVEEDASSRSAEANANNNEHSSRGANSCSQTEGTRSRPYMPASEGWRIYRDPVTGLVDSPVVMILSVCGCVLGIPGTWLSFGFLFGIFALILSIPAVVLSATAVWIAYAKQAKRTFAVVALTISLIGPVVSGLQMGTLMILGVTATAGAKAVDEATDRWVQEWKQKH